MGVNLAENSEEVYSLEMFSKALLKKFQYANAWNSSLYFKKIINTEPSNLDIHILNHPLEEEVATDSSILAWIISWTEEPGGLQSMELQKSLSWLSNWARAH